MSIDNDYTLLPFYYPLTTAKLLFISFALLMTVLIIKTIIYKTSLTLHRAPTAILFGYIQTCIINVMLCTFLYWYIALPICLVMSCVFAFTTSGEVKDANTEERIGVWGLNRDIKQIRGELFNDMSIEEQLEYSKTVRQTKFSPILFVIITMLAALVFILTCHFLDIGYLFRPVLVQ